jgi:hypothetical protein
MRQTERYVPRKGWMNWRAEKKLWTQRESGSRERTARGFARHMRRIKQEHKT